MSFVKTGEEIACVVSMLRASIAPEDLSESEAGKIFHQFAPAKWLGANANFYLPRCVDQMHLARLAVKQGLHKDARVTVKNLATFYPSLAQRLEGRTGIVEAVFLPLGGDSYKVRVHFPRDGRKMAYGHIFKSSHLAAAPFPK